MSRPFETEVRHDFERARQRGFLADLRAIFARRSRDLIPYHELRERVSPESESYRGMQTVPLAQIVGSMDRFQDFNREFFPRQRFRPTLAKRRPRLLSGHPAAADPALQSR